MEASCLVLKPSVPCNFCYSAKGPWNKHFKFIFPAKYLIPKSLKVSQWLNRFCSNNGRIGSWLWKPIGTAQPNFNREHLNFQAGHTVLIGLAGIILVHTTFGLPDPTPSTPDVRWKLIFNPTIFFSDLRLVSNKILQDNSPPPFP